MGETSITIWQGVKGTRIYHLVCLERRGKDVLVRQWGKRGVIGQVKVERGNYLSAREYRTRNRFYDTVFETRSVIDPVNDSLEEILGRIITGSREIPREGYTDAKVPLLSSKVTESLIDAYRLLCDQDPIDRRPEYQAPEPEPEIDMTELAREGFGAW